MRLWDDPSIPPVPVRWFRADPGAGFLGFPTFAVSRDWDREGKLGNDTPLPDLGEQQFGGSWSNGANRPTYLGENAHGERDVWFRGGIPGVDPAFVTDANGALPNCVSGIPWRLDFGVRLGVGADPAAHGVRPLALTAALTVGEQLGQRAGSSSRPTLALRIGAGPASRGTGQARPVLALKAEISAPSHAVVHQQPALPLAVGAQVVDHARAGSSPALALLASLAATQTGGGVSQMSMGLQALLEALTELEARVLISLAIKAELEGLSELEHRLAETLALKAGVSVPAIGHGADQPAPRGKLSVSITMSAVSLQPQPAGFCGQLSNTVVVRFSGSTGTCTAWDGQSVTLTFSVGSWSGSITIGGGSHTVQIACDIMTGKWRLSVSGPTYSGNCLLTGTSGANPNLAGSITWLSGCSGTTAAAVTRT